MNGERIRSATHLTIIGTELEPAGYLAGILGVTTIAIRSTPVPGGSLLSAVPLCD